MLAEKNPAIIQREGERNKSKMGNFCISQNRGEYWMLIISEMIKTQEKNFIVLLFLKRTNRVKTKGRTPIYINVSALAKSGKRKCGRISRVKSKNSSAPVEAAS